VSEYNIDFSEKLIDCAKILAVQGIDTFEASQALIYLSHLSCEIALKAFLEKAGKPTNEIRALSHDESKLLDEFSSCLFKEDIGDGRLIWKSASNVRGQPVNERLTIGDVLSAERFGASKYPNEIRYCDRFRDFAPAEIRLQTAVKLLDWVKTHYDCRYFKDRDELLKNLGSDVNLP
jgi:hypothetical protein